jgi:penicillin-binding protein 1A
MKKYLIAAAVVAISAPFALFTYYYTQFNYDLDKLINYTPSLTTKVYDRNGDKLANMFDAENRYYVSFNQVPAQLVEALLAIEDTSFFEHDGVNFDAIFRAMFKDLRAGRMVEGASTLTQQLVKNTLLTREKKISRKMVEVIYAMKLEHELTKEQILERYLNEIYLGHGYYGIKTASEGYFHKDLNQLTLKEMAILVGLPKAPSFYSPTKNYEISLGRANRVIDRMHTLGWIDDKTYDAATKEQPQVFDSTLTQNQAPFVVDEAVRQLADKIPDIKTGGYDIYTTIDLNMQKSANDAIKQAYKESIARTTPKDGNVSNKLNGALISLEPSTGKILALVGSVDYAQSSFNRITQGKRQPGSAFKPFIYQIALDSGYSGASQLTDLAKSFSYEKDGEEITWQPENYEKDYQGVVSLRDALVHSKNLATINMVTDIGLGAIINKLKNYGIVNVPHDLSMALGSITLSPLELAQYYSSFANDGVQTQPYLITKVVKDGKVVYTHKDLPSRQVTTPQQTYLLTSILQDVVRRGTGTLAAVPGLEVAGKTGTTNNNADAWFAGYSPNIETIVWFGNDDNTPMKRSETGGRLSAPAFSYFYRGVLRSYPQIKRNFTMPDGVTSGQHGGRTEYFTSTSRAPKSDSAEKSNEQLVF